MEQEEQLAEEQVEDQEAVEVREDVGVILKPAMVRAKSSLHRQSRFRLFPISKLEYVLSIYNVIMLTCS
jgi:hypothetical protein